MPIVLKREEVVRQQAVEERHPLRADPKRVPRGPRHVPEMHEKQIRPKLPQRARTRRQVVIVQPHDRVARGLRGDRLREPPVDRLVRLPVPRPHADLVHDHVAERPQDLVRIAVIVAVDVRPGERDTLERVARVVIRHLHPAIRVGDREVRVTVAPCDPGARDSLHHRVQGGHQSPGGTLHADASRAGSMRVRFAIADDHQLAPFQHAVELLKAPSCDDHASHLRRADVAPDP